MCRISLEIEYFDPLKKTSIMTKQKQSVLFNFKNIFFYSIDICCDVFFKRVFYIKSAKIKIILKSRHKQRQ